MAYVGFVRIVSTNELFLMATYHTPIIDDTRNYPLFPGQYRACLWREAPYSLQYIANDVLPLDSYESDRKAWTDFCFDKMVSVYPMCVWPCFDSNINVTVSLLNIWTIDTVLFLWLAQNVKSTALGHVSDITNGLDRVSSQRIKPNDEPFYYTISYCYRQNLVLEWKHCHLYRTVIHVHMDTHNTRSLRTGLHISDQPNGLCATTVILIRRANPYAAGHKPTTAAQ